MQDEEEIVTRFLAAGMGPLFFSPGFLTTAAVAVAELIWLANPKSGLLFLSGMAKPSLTLIPAVFPSVTTQKAAAVHEA
jgi:hypothetical protein